MPNPPICGKLCRLGALRHIFKPQCCSCFQKAEEWHWYYSHDSSASTTSSKITKCFSELQVFRTLQDTNNWHLQQGSLEGSELYVVVGILADRSEEAGVKCCHLLHHSFHYFKSAARSVLKRVMIQQQQGSTWDETGSGNPKLWSEEWNDASHSWVPRASTKALGCTQGAPTFAFWFATLLRSKHCFWLSFVPPRSQRQPKNCPQVCSEVAQLTTCVVDKNDGTSGPDVCFYSFIALNCATGLWVQPLMESCTWYSWTCNAWNKQAGSSSLSGLLNSSKTKIINGIMLVVFPCPFVHASLWRCNLETTDWIVVPGAWVPNPPNADGCTPVAFWGFGFGKVKALLRKPRHQHLWVGDPLNSVG